LRNLEIVGALSLSLGLPCSSRPRETQEDEVLSLDYNFFVGFIYLACCSCFADVVVLIDADACLVGTIEYPVILGLKEKKPELKAVDRTGRCGAWILLSAVSEFRRYFAASTGRHILRAQGHFCLGTSVGTGRWIVVGTFRGILAQFHPRGLSFR
jgi:hypothetical protein